LKALLQSDIKFRFRDMAPSANLYDVSFICLPVEAMFIWGAERPGRRKLRAALGGLALSLALICPAGAQTADPDRPLEGEAYTSAEEAYKAFGQGNYQAAAS